MDHTYLEIALGYLVAVPLIVGAPAVFFLIVFMPALQNTKGRMVGYKELEKYGKSSINTFSRGDLKVGPDVPVRELTWPLS